LKVKLPHYSGNLECLKFQVFKSACRAMLFGWPMSVEELPPGGLRRVAGTVTPAGAAPFDLVHASKAALVSQIVCEA
jgi:hypothetical protein